MLLTERTTSFWITAGRGGAGKTYLASVLTCDAIDTNKRFLLIDSNPKNADSWGLFRPLSDGRVFPVGETGFSYTRILFPDSDETAGFLVSVDPFADLFLTLPGYGISQLLISTDQIYQFFLDVENSFFQAIQDIRIIHDTDLHLANLYVPDSQAKIWDPPFVMKKLSALMAMRTYLCFIWTVAAMRRDYELDAIRQRANWLLLNWRRLSIINVLNPIALSFDRPFTWGAGNRSIPELEALAREDSLAPGDITVGTLIDYAITAQQVRDRAAILSTLALLIHTQRPTPREADRVRAGQRRRPPDVIAFPGIVGDMALFTDELANGGVIEGQESRSAHYAKLKSKMGTSYEVLRKQIPVQDNS